MTTHLDDEHAHHTTQLKMMVPMVEAASVMLAALQAVETTLNNGAPITAGTRYNMRAAIKAAEAAGIRGY